MRHSTRKVAALSFFGLTAIMSNAMADHDKGLSFVQSSIPSMAACFSLMTMGQLGRNK